MGVYIRCREAAIFGRRLVSEILRRDSVAVSNLSSRRSLHLTGDDKKGNETYSKNIEDNANPTVVPDHLIPNKKDGYWAPHPETGVFGPVSSSGKHLNVYQTVGKDKDSVLEQKTFIRPLEDLDKPQTDPSKSQ